MAQRVRNPHRGRCPSSVTQLPILTALHARLPTLFRSIIHDEYGKVNNNFCKNHRKLKILYFLTPLLFAFFPDII